MKIYVASSWRNNIQPNVVSVLRNDDHDVYDFKNPKHGGFKWEDLDPAWETWTETEYIKNLYHPIASRGFLSDMNALKDCDACVLIMPCGRSAHLELGYAVGAGKKTAILTSDAEPELMSRMADLVTDDFNEIVKFLSPAY
jgi:hypothetical protein